MATLHIQMRLGSELLPQFVHLHPGGANLLEGIPFPPQRHRLIRSHSMQNRHFRAELLRNLDGPGQHCRIGWVQPFRYGYLRRSRPMTMRWIWLVPSKIWVTLASRKNRSTG